LLYKTHRKRLTWLRGFFKFIRRMGVQSGGGN
jgi:hypothetical protein